IQIEAIDIESDTAARYAIRIAQRQNLPDYLLAQFARFVCEQSTNGAFANPGAARFPAMLPEHEPDGFLGFTIPMCNRPQHEVAAARCFADRLLLKIGIATNFTAQFCQSLVRVRRAMGDPE